MNRMTLATALSLAAMLPLATTHAYAETTQTQAALCAETPAKAAKAGIDCAATSAIPRDEDKAEQRYPSSPTNFGNGIVF